MKKKSLVGYAPKDWSMVYTVFNTVNVAFVIQKTRQESLCRYDDGKAFKNIVKVRITIEELSPKRKE